MDTIFFVWSGNKKTLEYMRFSQILLKIGSRDVTMKRGLGASGTQYFQIGKKVGQKSVMLQES